jgi:hypothetical protein
MSAQCPVCSKADIGRTIYAYWRELRAYPAHTVGGSPKREPRPSASTAQKGGVSGTLRRVLPPNYFFVMRAPHEQRLGPAEVPHGTSASTSAAFFYDAAFAQTMMRGLVAASLGQVTVLSLIKVTGILRGPQYPITSTSFWLHSPLHAAAVQSRRMTRMAFSAVPGGPAGPSVP